MIGEISPLFYDLEYYAANSPDLAAAGLTDPAQLLDHLKRFGVAENRKFSPLIDMDFYGSYYPDLQAAGFDREGLLEHLQTFGIGENRRVSAAVNLDFYRTANADLAGLNYEQLLQHMQTFGIDEGRRFSEFFDPQFYRNSNADLAGFSNKQLLEHFQKFGISESRTFSISIDLDYYRNTYADLASLSNEQLLQHYEQFGIAENRSGSALIDVQYYGSLYADLGGFSREQLLDHLLQFGIGENRKFSRFVDLDIYRANNADLANFSNLELLEHLDAFGLVEARRFSAEFDLQVYSANNPGLLASFGGNFELLFEYFIRSQNMIAPPVEPQPVEPEPVEPQPVEPQPVEPQPVEPQPVEPQLPDILPPANNPPVVAAAIPDQTATAAAAFSLTIPAGTFTDADGQVLTLSATLDDQSPLPDWLSFDAATGTFSGTATAGDAGTLNVKVTATDSAGAFVSDIFEIVVEPVTPVNTAPELGTALDDQIATADTEFSFNLPAGTFTDADAGDTLTLSATLEDGSDLPAWLSFDAATGTFSGTATAGDAGTVNVKVTATDSAGAFVSDIFEIVVEPVTPVNTAPELGTALDDQIATADTEFSFNLPAGTFTDADAGDTLTLSATLEDGSDLPAWLSFDAATGTFSGTATAGDAGTVNVKVTATDSAGAFVSDIFEIVVEPVTPVNTAPELGTALDDQIATADTEFSFNLPAGTFTDADAGDTLTLSATLEDGSDLPAWLSFDAATGTFSGTATAGDAGTLNVKVTATDSAGAFVSDIFEIVVEPVTPVNTAPELGTALDDQIATADTEFSFNLPAGTFTDADAGDTLTLSATLEDGSDLPAWLSFDAATGTFSGTATAGDAGTVNVKVTATDSAGAFVSDIFEIVVEPVTPVNTAPELGTALDDQIATADTEFSFNLPAGTFTDADAGDTLTLSATLEDGSDLPAWLSFDAATGTFSGTATAGDAGTVNVKVTATDSAGAFVSDIFEIVVEPVTPVNTAPELGTALDDQIATADTEFSFNLPAGTFTDADAGDTLTLSATLEDGSDLPAWLSFDAATGTFSGTATAGDAGTVNVKVTATDSAGAFVSDIFEIVVEPVTPVNTAPELGTALDDQIATADTEFSFNLPAGTFTDADAGDTLTLSATLEDGSDLPAWLSFDAATGTFSGTATAGDAGTVNVKVTATDSAGGSASDIFAITVGSGTPTNNPPVVQTPIADLSAKQDTAFTFNLTEGTFSDSDAGDTLSYTATLATDSDTIPGNDSLPAWLTVDAATGNLSGTPANADVGTLDVTVTATDSAGAFVSDIFEIVVEPVTPVNTAPELGTALDDQIATADTEFSFNLPAGTFTDADAGDTLTLSATLEDGSDLPAWLSFDAATGTFSGTATAGDAGTVNVKVTATDSAGGSASDIFAITVGSGTPTNNPPVVQTPIADLSAKQDTAFTFNLTEGTFSDSDAGDTLSYTATLATDSDTIPGNDSLPAWLTVDAATGNLSGTPANADVGTLDVTVTATDSAGLSASDTFTLTVANVNDAPVVQTPIADLSATEDTAFTFNLTEGTFSDSDAGDTLSYTATLATDSDTIPGNDSLPAWLTVDAATGNLSGTPANADVGTLDVTVTATDSAGLSASDTFTLTVANVNDAPVVQTPIADLSATEDTAFTFNLTEGTFSDSDAGDTLSYTATLATDSDTIPGNDSLPAWLTVDAATGNLSGTPANADVGTLDVTVTATDSAGLSASDTFTLTVANVNDAPVVQTPIADLSATEDTAFTFNLTEGTFSDSDAGDTLSYTATLATDSDTIPGNDSLPAWLTVDAATGNLSGTPANADVGTLDVTVTATDSAGLSASDTFTLTVANVNDAPVVQTPIADLSATEDTAFTFTLTEGTFSDLDADDTLSYTATLATDSDTVPGNDSLPAWLSFDATTGTFSGTPANADVGALDVTVTATDSAGLSASDTFALTVANVNDPPVLATPILDLTATEDTAFTFTLTEGTFSDLDADDTLSYTATLATDSDTVPGNDSLPAWLSFDATTGNLSGTPANADVGTLEIALTATDSAGLSASDTFALTVANVNDAPVVQTPIADLSATEDTAFTFNLTEGTFSDSDAGDTLSYTATLATDSDTIPGNDSLPAWLTVDAATGNLSGTPANADVGTLEIALTATDSAGLSASDTFALTVANVNDPPVLATPILDLTATEDTAFTFTLTEGTFSDLDADDTLTYTATLATDSDTVPGNDSLPAWLTVDAATGNLSGTPANADVGTLDVTVTATDSAGAFASDTFTLTVANVNDAPTLNLDSLIPNQTAPVDTLFSFQVAENTFLDADAGDTLTYLATLEDGTALPAWLTFDPATGTFTGTPTSADADSLDITVTATDAAGESASDTFALGVGNIGAVKALFEAYEEVLNANPNQIDAVLDLVTDDITWSIHGGDRLRVQFANDYVGKEDTDPTDQTFAVGTYFRSLVANYFPRDFEPLEFIPNPDDPSQIAVRVRQNGAATQTGKTFESDYTYLVTVNDQGLISSLDGYFNTYPVAAAIADQPEIPADDPLTGELAPIDETFDPATARSVAEQMWTALAGGDVATAAGLNAPDATWSFAVGGPSFLPYVGAAQGFTSDGQPLAGDFSNAGPILGELLGPLGSVVTAGTITIQDTYVEGNRVLVQLQETGATAIETGQTYDLDLSSWITVGADGKIESNQVIVDTIRTVNALRPGATFPLSPEPGETRHAPPFFVAGSQINSQLLAYDEQGNFTGVLGQANGGDTAEFIGPIGLTYGPNGNVYIGMGLNRANGQIINAVLEYDGVSGEFIGERQNGFSGDGNNGVTDAFGDAFVFLDFSQNPPAPIADPDTGSLGSFINPATGAPFNPAVDVGVTPVPGLFIPTGLKFGPSSAANDGDKQNLYVSSGFTSRILEYDGETGQFLGTFGVRPNGAQGNFMVPGPGNTQPDFTVMIFGPDGNIYVTSILSDPDEDESNGEGAVLRFVGPGQVGPNGEAPGTLIGIGEHADLGIFGDASNAFEYTNLNGQPARLNETSAFAFGPDLDLYVNSALTGEVLKYAGPTKANAGEFLGVYADLKDEANGPATPAGANRESLALSGIGFGPDGTLYVGNSFENELGAPVAGSEFSAYTPDPANPNRGIYQGPFGDVSTADSRLLLPTTPEFVFTKNSYDELNTPHKRFDQVAFVVGSNAEGASATDNADALAAYDAAGNFIKFIGAEEAGQDSIPLEGIGGVVLAPSGKILVSSTQTNQVLEFNSLTGDYAGVFGDLNAGTTFNGTPLNSPTALTLGPNNDLYLIDAGNERVLRFDGSDGTFVENDANGDGTPDGVAVPSNGDAFADRLTDIAFGPDGRLYVAVNPPTNPDDPATPEVEAPQLGQAQIRVYNPNTGEQDVARSITGLNFVSSMAFGPDGRLYAIDAPSEIANPVDPVTGDPVTPGNSQIFVYNIDNTHPLEDAPTVAGQLDLGAAGAGDIDVSPDGLILGTNYAAGNLTQHTVTSNPDGTVTLAAGTPIAVGLPDAAADTDGLSRPTDPLFIAERFY